MIYIKLKTKVEDTYYDEIMEFLARKYDFRDWTPNKWDCGSYLSLEQTREILDKEFGELEFELYVSRNKME